VLYNLQLVERGLQLLNLITLTIEVATDTVEDYFTL